MLNVRTTVTVSVELFKHVGSDNILRCLQTLSVAYALDLVQPLYVPEKGKNYRLALKLTNVVMLQTKGYLIYTAYEEPHKDKDGSMGTSNDSLIAMVFALACVSEQVEVELLSHR